MLNCLSNKPGRTTINIGRLLAHGAGLELAEPRLDEPSRPVRVVKFTLSSNGDGARRGVQGQGRPAISQVAN